jgi:hypothetical protein
LLGLSNGRYNRLAGLAVFGPDLKEIEFKLYGPAHKAKVQLASWTSQARLIGQTVPVAFLRSHATIHRIEKATYSTKAVNLLDTSR